MLVERSEKARLAQAELLAPAEETLGPSAEGEIGGQPRPEPDRGPIVTTLPGLPAGPLEGVVLANELLDNLAFDIVERTDRGWAEVRVGVESEGQFVEMTVPASEEIEYVARAGVGDVPIGTRLPLPLGVRGWLQIGRASCRARV